MTYRHEVAIHGFPGFLVQSEPALGVELACIFAKYRLVAMYHGWIYPYHRAFPQMNPTKLGTAFGNDSLEGIRHPGMAAHCFFHDCLSVCIV